MNTIIERNKYHNNFEVSGSWGFQSKSLREKFPVLTEEDVKLEKGKDEDLLEKLGSRLQKDREEVIRLIQNIPIDTATAFLQERALHNGSAHLYE